MTRDEALRLLGLDEDASEEDIRVAYKEVAQILHPDKYADNKRLAERATEQFKHVNEARDLLLGKGSSRRAAAATAGGRRKTAHASAGEDRTTALRARLAGIAAARVQLTTQLDTELDRRRMGIYLIVGGLLAGLVGRFIKPLLAIAPVAFVWGIIQIVSVLGNISMIKKQLETLDAEREKCERELAKL
jgi:cobalamin biosynthesis Mg chelatase CobN